MNPMDPSSTASGGATVPPPPPPPQHRPLDRFFDAVRGIGLARTQHRVIGGVCGGIAERTGIDVTVVRVVAVVLALFGGLGFLAYGLAWLLLPEPDGRIHAEGVLHGDVTAGAVGAIIVTLSSLGSSGGLWGNGFGSLGWGWHGPFGVLWHLTGVAVFVGVVAFVIYVIRVGRTPHPGHPGQAGGPYAAPSYSATPSAPFTTSAPYPPPAPTAPFPPSATFPPSAPLPPLAPVPAPTGPTATPPRSSAPKRRTFGASGTLVAGGLALVGAAATALVMQHGSYDARTSVMTWAVALVVLAAALVVGGLLGRRSGIVSFFALVAMVGTTTAAVIPRADHNQLAGQRVWTPVSTSTATGGFALGAGDATLDLGRLDISTIGTTPIKVPVSVGAGRLTIRVPADLDVHVKASAGAGNLQRLDDSVTTSDADGDDSSDVGGVSVDRTYDVGTGTEKVYVVAKVGFGTIRIQQEQP
jgi:phage shock protein PspC (stress-responsive transcriptional regulator)